ncbi:MAG: twin-arginine translocase TatA/TatE family subunit [Planctomycetaceae bacterium]|nr:twin-arginine translocase TatA/TatE family subunit [Planctomycetaceae bacterium]
MPLPLAFLNFGMGEMLLLAIVALLLYGSDLPEVAKTWGKAYAEFRRNLNGFRSELNNVIYSEPENDAPRKLQYYPEFHQDTVTDVPDDDATASDDAADDGKSTATDAVVSSVPIATTPATGTVAAGTEDDERKDAHGAA